MLPRSGRPGRAPAWPWARPATPTERAHWTRLWKSPQAVAWEQLALTDSVALLCSRLAVVQGKDATAADANVVRQLMADLGLSRPGLKANAWRIDADAAPPAPDAPAAGESLRSRLRLIDDAAV